MLRLNLISRDCREIYYDLIRGFWHLFDADLRGWYRLLSIEKFGESLLGRLFFRSLAFKVQRPIRVRGDPPRFAKLGKPNLEEFGKLHLRE